MPQTFTIAQVRNVQIKFSANSFYKLNLSPPWPKKKQTLHIHVTLCFGCLSQPSLWVLHLRILRSSFLSFQGESSVVCMCDPRSKNRRLHSLCKSDLPPSNQTQKRTRARGGGYHFCWKEAPKNLRRWDVGKCWELQCVCYWRRVPPEELAIRNPDATPKNSCKSPDGFPLLA